MKILQIIPCIGRSVQGARTRFQEIIKNSRFFHIVISSPGMDATEYNMIGEESGPNWSIRESIGSKLSGKRAGFWLSWPIFRAHIFFETIRHKVSVIHVHNSGGMSMAGGWVAKILGLPLIYEVHDFVATSKSVKNSAHVDVPRRLIKRSLRHEKWLIDNSTQVIVQTEVTADRLSQIYNVPREKIIVIGNKVDTDRFNEQLYQKESKQLRMKWGIHDDELVFLYAGYINWFNGIEELLSAFKGIKNIDSMRLIIFGDGELREKVIASAALNKRINYFGTVSPSEMPGVYAASDCVIMARPDCSEVQEATPMKLLEAMSMSRLTICSRVKGLTRICNEQTSLIVAPGDINELRKAMEYVARKFFQLDQMRIRAREHIVKLMQKEDPSKVLDYIYKKITYDLKENEEK